MPSVLPTMLPLESRRLLAFDPAFAVPISGFGSQNVTDVAADADGNVYAVGTISGSTEFNPARNRNLELNTGTDGGGTGFIVKYTPAGVPLWAKSIPGRPAKVAIDSAGNAFVAGQFGDTQDFDPSEGQAPLISGLDVEDGFLVKFDSAGGFLNANKFTAGHDTNVTGLAIDNDGYVVVAGTAEAGALEAVPLHGGEDHDDVHLDRGFVAKFTARARSLYINVLAGDDGYAKAAGMAIDPTDGGVYVVGTAQAGVDLDPSHDGEAFARAGGTYLLKLDDAGSYVRHTLWNSGTLTPAAVAVDSAGNAYVVGGFEGTIDFNPSSRRTYNLTAEPLGSAFVAKVSPAGGLVLASTFGAGGSVFASTVAIRGDEVAIGGNFAGRADFNPGPRAFRLSPSGSQDGFVARFDRNIVLQDALRYGNPTGESRPAIFLGRSGLIVGGSIAGGSAANGAGVVDFDPDPDDVLEITPRANDGGEGFVVRYT
ncbi:MAG: hypothetical protein ACAI43_20860 [Phycisphaerae bacterium]|nr:hypothetical protein [Tepidisphaeraceae bacterium]